MNKIAFRWILALSAVSLLILWHSIIAIAALALLATGLICYCADSRSRVSSVRADALWANLAPMLSGFLLFSAALATAGSGWEAELGFQQLLWIMSYAFSLVAAPVMIWQHINVRLYKTFLRRSVRACRVPAESCAHFEPRPICLEVAAFDCKPRRKKVDSDCDQLRIAI